MSVEGRMVGAGVPADFRCIECGDPVVGTLSALGSTRCQDCRDANGDHAARVDAAAAVAVEWASELARELERSRRYERPFALIGLGAGEPELLRRIVRTVDRAWSFDDCVYVLLPESDRSVAEGLLKRLEATYPALEGRRAAIAVFPENGVTTRALLRAARPERSVLPVNDHVGARNGNGHRFVRVPAFRVRRPGMDSRGSH